MDGNGANMQVDFQRRPGGRRGCGCCGLWAVGLAALPVLAVIALFVAA
jgi:hypothetical protein